jgi:hypothetical protein
MGAALEVRVLSQAGHSERSEPQLRKGDRSWEGSGERNRGPTYRNRIRGGAVQGERANDREALVAKGRGRRSGGRAAKGSVLAWGDLASRLKGRRREAEREVSKGSSSEWTRRQGWLPAYRKPEERRLAKGRTEGRNTSQISNPIAPEVRHSWRSSSRTVGVNSRGACEAVKGAGDEGETRLRAAKPVNRPNRRMRTRLSGGVGGA